MSQYPPNPGQPMQPPFGQAPIPPQYGQPYGDQGYPQQPRGTSGAAIGSLICGILGCFGITPFIALILGFVGIGATKNGQKSGRGMAIAGIILALLWLGGFVLFGGGIYAIYIGSKPARAVATQFTNDMLAGNVDAAVAECDPEMSREDLQAASDKMKSWGTLNNLTVVGAKVDNTNGITQWELGGSAQFSSAGPKAATFSIKKESDGSLKIVKFNFQ